MDPNPPWKVVARRTAYDSDWIGVQLVDIHLPDGTLLRDIHLVDYKHAAAAVIPIRQDGQVLLIEHYRFQTDTRGWEVPAGKIDEGETPEQTVARELLEETGHQGDSFKHLGHYHPSNGSSNQVFHVYVARGVRQVGEIEDTNEVMRLRWFSIDQVRGLIEKNQILDGLSLTSLCWAIARGEI